MNLELIARGVAAGRVPLDSYVRNEAWTVWRPVSDVVMVSEGAEPGHLDFGPSEVRERGPIPRAPDSEDTFEEAGAPDSDERPTLPHIPAWIRNAPPPGSAPSRDSRPTLPRAVPSFRF